MLSDPSGISKMMKAVQGLTKGMSGGGGPLFGGGQQAPVAGQMTDVNAPQVGQGMPPMPPKFKTRF